jgi:hypothetical protein
MADVTQNRRDLRDRIEAMIMRDTTDLNRNSDRVARPTEAETHTPTIQPDGREAT